MTQSKYRGIAWDESKQKWKARVSKDGRRHDLGRFDTEEEAARAVDAKSKELYGDKARFNFPDDQPREETPVTIRWHPFAEKFPLIPPGDERDAFLASLQAAKGNRETVKFRRLKGGMKEYIDGRNRMRACEHLGLKCYEQEVMLEDDEVEAFIIRKNLRRRHMTLEGREKVARYLRGRGKSLREIATALGVSPATVHRDLDQPGVQNGTPERITGGDGKSYSSKAKEREPGGDTRGLNRGGHKPGGPVNGSAKFVWSEHYSGPMGKLRRGVDELFRVYGDINPNQPIRDPQHAGILRQLEEVGTSIKALYKRLTREEAPE